DDEENAQEDQAEIRNSRIDHVRQIECGELQGDHPDPPDDVSAAESAEIASDSPDDEHHPEDEGALEGLERAGCQAAAEPCVKGAADAHDGSAKDKTLKFEGKDVLARGGCGGLVFAG